MTLEEQATFDQMRKWKEELTAEVKSLNKALEVNSSRLVAMDTYVAKLEHTLKVGVPVYFHIFETVRQYGHPCPFEVIEAVNRQYTRKELVDALSSLADLFTRLPGYHGQVRAKKRKTTHAKPENR